MLLFFKYRLCDIIRHVHSYKELSTVYSNFDLYFHSIYFLKSESRFNHKTKSQMLIISCIAYFIISTKETKHNN